MIRIGARDYDPATGRFLSPDPIIYLNAPTQWNPYQYGDSNPIDPPIVWKYERVYRSTLRNRWAAVDTRQRYERAGYRKYYEPKRPRAATGGSKSIPQAIVDGEVQRYKTAFRPMTGAQAKAAACRADCPMYSEMLLTDHSFSEQQAAQASVPFDMWSLIFGGVMGGAGEAAGATQHVPDPKPDIIAAYGTYPWGVWTPIPQVRLRRVGVSVDAPRAAAYTGTVQVELPRRFCP